MVGSLARLMITMRASALLLVGALVSCVGGPRAESPGQGGTGGGASTGPATTVAPTPSSTTTTSQGSVGATSEPDGSSDSSSGGAKFDLPPGGDGPSGFGCQKVDFLFVVDNSGSMADEQQSLVASFPGFMDTIRSEVDADDFHIMVVSTDGAMSQTSGSGTQEIVTCSAGNCTCEPAPDCCEAACEIGDTCFGVPCGAEIEIEACDTQLGSGRRASTQGDCGLAPQARFMAADEPDLEDKFLCLAEVGTFGSGNEIPMEAMLAAVDDEQIEGEGCNLGFLRDDAVLVVTFITDEEDDPDGFFGSEGSPETWRSSLLAAKNDNETAAVVLALIGDNDQPDGICPPLADDGVNGAEPAPRLRAFAESFGSRGFVGSVCAPSYEAFFEQAVGVVDTACDDFEPEG